MTPESAQAQLEVILRFADAGMAAGVGALQQGLEEYTGVQNRATASTAQHTAAMQAGNLAAMAYKGSVGLLGGILSKVWTGIGGLATGVVGLSVKMAEGDSILHAFRESMGHLGIDADRTLERLNAASKNLVSNEVLMQRTNQAMSFLGRDSLQQYVQLADKHQKLSDQFKDTTGVMEALLTGAMATARQSGQSTEAVFSQMLLGAARYDSQMLRSIGIQTSMATASADWAKKTGKAVVTEQDKMMAFLDLVISKGRENVANFGISTGGINTQLQRITTSFKNMAQDVTSNFDEGFTRPILESAADMAEQLGRIVDTVTGKLGKALERVPQPVIAAVGTFLSLKSVLSLLGPALSALSAILPGVGAAVSAMAGPVTIAAAAVAGFYALLRTNDDFRQWFDSLKLGEKLTGLLSDAWERLDGLWHEANRILRPLIETFGDLSRDVGDAIEAFTSGDIAEGFDETGDAANDLIAGLLASGKRLYDDWAPTVEKALTGTAETIQGWVEKTGGFLAQALSDLEDWVDDYGFALEEGMNHPQGRGFDGMAMLLDSAWNTLMDVGGKVLVWLAGWAAQLGTVLWNTLSQADWGQIAGRAADLFWNGLLVAFNLAYQAGGWAVGKLARIFYDGIIWLGNAVGEFWANDGPSRLIAGLGRALVALGDWILNDAVPWLWGKLKALGSSAIQGFVAGSEVGWKGWGDSVAGQMVNGMDIIGAAGEERARTAAGRVDYWWNIINQKAAEAEWLASRAETHQRLMETTERGLNVARQMQVKPSEIPSNEPSAPGAPPTGGGGGKKPKEPKGDKKGAEKDPLEAAYSAISSIASAVSSGIDAINKLWREWRGAPGVDVWDEVFDTFDMMVERMAKLASGVSPEKAAAGKAFADMVAGYASALTGIVELGDKTARGRQLSEDSLKRLFASAELILDFAGDFAGDFLKGDFSAGGKSKTGLEEAVKKIRLTTDVAGVLSAWADAFGKVADSAVKLTGRRIDVNWGQLSGFATGALDLAVGLKDRLTSGITSPRVLIDMRDTVELLGPMLGSIGVAADAAGKVESARWPSGGQLGQAGAFMADVLDLADGLTSRMGARHGEHILIALEDIQTTGEALAEWLPMVADAAEGSRALLTARFDLDLTPALDFVSELLDFASGLTEQLRAKRAMPGGGDDLRDHLEELGLVGEGGKTWLDTIAAIADTAETLDMLALGRKFGRKPDLGPVYDFIVELLNLQSGVFFAQTAGGRFDANQAQDIAAVGQVAKGWLEVVAAIAPALDAMRSVQGHALWGGGKIDLHPVFEMLMQIGVESGRVWSAVQNALGNLAPDALGTSGIIAQTFTGWLEVVGRVQGVLAGLRLSRSVGFRPEDITRTFDVLEVIGGESWRRFQAAMTTPGGASPQAASQQVAETFGAWEDVVGKIGTLMESLRLARAMNPGEVEAQITEFFGTLSLIAEKSWEFLKPSAGKPGFDAMQASSQNTAVTFSAWIDTIVGIAQATRALDLTRPVRPNVWPIISDILVGLNNLAQNAADIWGQRDDPTGDLERASLAAQALGDFLSVVVDVASGTNDITRTLEPTVAEWAAVERSMNRVWEIAERMVKGSGLSDIPELAEEAKKKWSAWAAMEADAADALGAVAGLSLENYLPPLERRWGQLETASERIWDVAQRLMNKWLAGDGGPADVANAQLVADKMSAWSDALSSAADGLSAIADLDIDMTSIRTITPDGETVLTRNAEAAMGIIDRLRESWSKGRRDPERDAELVSSFADMLGSVVSPLGSVFDLLQGMAGKDVPKGGVEKLGQMVPFIKEAVRLFTELSAPMFDFIDTFLFPGGGSGLLPDPDELERARRDQERSWDHVRAYVSLVGDGASAIGQIVGVMVSLGENSLKLGDLTIDIRRQLEGFIRESTDMWSDLADELTDLDDPEQRTLWDRLSAWAGQVGDIIDPIGTVVDVMSSLLDLKWEEIEVQPGQVQKRLRDLDLGKTFMSSISRAVESMFLVMRDFERQLPELMGILDDEPKLDAELNRLGSHADIVGRIADMIGKLSDPLSAWFNQTGGKGFSWGLFVNRYGNDSTTARRTNRADWYAKQLKEGIIRAVDAMVSALSGITVPKDIDVKTKALYDAVEAVASAIDRTIQIGTLDTEGKGPGTFRDQVRMLVEAGALLSDGFKDFSVPEGLDEYALTVESAVDSFVAALARINELEMNLAGVTDFAAAVRLLGELFGGLAGGRAVEWTVNVTPNFVISEAMANLVLPIAPFIREGLPPIPLPIQPVMPEGGGLSIVFPELPTIVVELPTIEINLKNEVNATLTMDGTEVARANTKLETKRHVHEPSAPSPS